MCLAQGPQRSDAGEARTRCPWSRVKHSTTEPLPSLRGSVQQHASKVFVLTNTLDPWEHSGSVVECLTWDRVAAGSSLTSVTVLCSWTRHIYPCLVLVQPRKTRPDITVVDWDLKNQLDSSTDKQCICINTQLKSSKKQLKLNPPPPMRVQTKITSCMGLSAVCDCGISWSYSLFFYRN